jgi:cysteine-rich repeat protein
MAGVACSPSAQLFRSRLFQIPSLVSLRCHLRSSVMAVLIPTSHCLLNSSVKPVFVLFFFFGGGGRVEGGGGWGGGWAGLQTVGSLIVLENSGAAVVTVVRTVNVLANCSVRLRAAEAPGSTAVAGTDFASSDVIVTFAPGQMQQTISITLFPSAVYRAADATLTVVLSGAINCTLASASLVVAIRGVIPPPAPAPLPVPSLVADSLVFRWSTPAWPSSPPAPWGSPLQFEARCNWTNSGRGLSGVYSSLLINTSDPTSDSAAVPTWSVTLTTLSAGTAVRCQARMYTAGGWGDFGAPGGEAWTASECSNGWREAGEECDDGNDAAGDGCASNCTVEAKWACAAPTPGQQDSCSNGCGGGTVAGVEECDDGNLLNGDGCGSSCWVEVGWVCPLPAVGKPSACSTVCGDNIWVGPGKEECDDGNAANGDGCSSACTIEPGAACVRAAGPGRGSVCHTCGNQIVERGEACDDGDRSGACAADCLSVQPGWNCAAAGGACTAGPLPPPQPQSIGLGVSWAAWEWDSADGLGLPVLYYDCRVAPAAGSSTDWGKAVALNATVSAAGVRPQLVATNLSAATAYLMRVRACSAAGCGAPSLDSFPATTLAAAYLALQALSAGLAEQAQTASRAVGLTVSGVSVLTPVTPPQPTPLVSVVGMLNESDFLALVQGQQSALPASSTNSTLPTTTVPASFAAENRTLSTASATGGGGWETLRSSYNVTAQVLLMHSNACPGFSILAFVLREFTFPHSRRVLWCSVSDVGVLLLCAASATLLLNESDFLAPVQGQQSALPSSATDSTLPITTVTVQVLLMHSNACPGFSILAFVLREFTVPNSRRVS